MTDQLLFDINIDFDLNLPKELESELKKKYNDDSIQLKVNNQIDNSITLSTNQPTTKQSILNEPLIKFKSYLLKPSNLLGYKSNQFYPSETNKIIIKNIVNDDLIVKMYAEYLQPDLEITDLVGSKLLTNTFYATYSQPVDKTKLNTRLNKKPKLNNWKIELLDTYSTQSLLIWSQTKLDLNKFDLNNKFYEFYSNKHLFIHFDTQTDLDEFKNQLSDCSYELVYNFDLFKHLFKRNQDSNKVKNPKKSQQSKVAQPKLTISDLSFFKQINMSSVNKFNIDSLIKMELDYIFYLNEFEPLVIGLLNSSQLLADLNINLAKIDYECRLDSNKRLCLRVRNTVESSAQYETRKQLLTDLLEDFYTHYFVYQIFELNHRLLPSQLESKLVTHLNHLNKRFTAVYLDYKTERLHTYGSVNSLNKVLKNLEQFLSTILKDDTNLTNQPTNQNKIIYNSMDSKNRIPKLNNSSGMIQLGLKYPLLNKSLICAKIFQDFKSDLKTVSGELFENESNSNLYVQSKSDQINRFLSNYEHNLLKEETIKLTAFNKEENLNQLVEHIKNENNLTDLKQIMNVFCKSDKVIQVELILKSNEINIYGYNKAVNGFKEYILKQMDKTLNKIGREEQFKLEFKVKLPHELKEALFVYFDSIYLNDLIKRLETLKAFATSTDTDDLVIGCLDKKLTNANKKNIVQMSSELGEWRANLNEFFHVYISKMKFTSETIQTPFERTQLDATNQFMYDKNSLDIKWISDNQIKVFGLIDEITKLKQRLETF